MQAAELLYTVIDHVAVITINRPERLNAWTPQIEREFRAKLEAAHTDGIVRCVVLTGAGRAFCAGMDMGVLQRASVEAHQASESIAAEDDFSQRYGYLLAFDKPLIAAINGAAAGVGLCLALYCDLRFVSNTAKLTTPYARRGLVAEHGLAWLLPHLVGPMHAADLLLSGRTITGEYASQIGMAIGLPEAGFLDDVLLRASEIANLTSPRSTRIIKRQLRDARYQTFGQATQVSDREMRACVDTEDFREGVLHFQEKRKPRFIGQ